MIADGAQPSGEEHMSPDLKFRIAAEPWEFEQIHVLNYLTFVQEIPQHMPNASLTLVDRFNQENAYVIALRGRQVVGMIAVRDKRPFSLDMKLDHLDDYLPKGHFLCEIRLLAIKEGSRHGLILQGLLSRLWEYCRGQGYTLAVISGFVQQERLYRHLGFRPFGPRVGHHNAQYQPMYLTVDSFLPRSSRWLRPSGSYPDQSVPVNLLPGPVAVSQRVRHAIGHIPFSHRSEEYLAQSRATKQLLCQLVNSRHVELLVGTGTLANDVIAGQLSLLPGRGLVVSNGEFGVRLIDHATRLGLSFETIRATWGRPLNLHAIKRHLDHHHDIAWLWAVHCETSTGMLNDLASLELLCRQRNVKLCLDCISSLGIVPLNLSEAYLASGVSGKGLRAYPGLAMVFYNHTLPSGQQALPRYLDLGLYASCDGVPFTGSSNLLSALHAAVADLNVGMRFEELTHLSLWLRTSLSALGYRLVSSAARTSPAVITIALPPALSSVEIGRQLDQQGFLLSYGSRYLRARNWIQICLMGKYSRCDLERLLSVMTKWTEMLNSRSQLVSISVYNERFAPNEESLL
jgi:aspartate aminotransferase-like enzyme